MLVFPRVLAFCFLGTVSKPMAIRCRERETIRFYDLDMYSKRKKLWPHVPKGVGSTIVSSSPSPSKLVFPRVMYSFLHRKNPFLGIFGGRHGKRGQRALQLSLGFPAPSFFHPSPSKLVFPRELNCFH
jgi:hypothetical protein